MFAIHSRPAVTIVVPTSNRFRVPVRTTIRGATLDSGISSAAIGSRPADARRAL